MSMSYYTTDGKIAQSWANGWYCMKHRRKLEYSNEMMRTECPVCHTGWSDLEKTEGKAGWNCESDDVAVPAYYVIYARDYRDFLKKIIGKRIVKNEMGKRQKASEFKEFVKNYWLLEYEN